MTKGAFAPAAKACLTGLVVSLLYLLALQPLSILEIPRLKVLDLFFAVRRLVIPKPQILNDFIVVTIDDESIEKIRERQPFPRKIYAAAVDMLMTQEPKLIAFDMIFSGRSDAVDDFLLAQSIRKAGNVILSSFVDQERNYVWPFHEFRQVAKASGVVNKLLDRDMHVRKAHLFYLNEQGNILAWSWELEIVAALLGVDLSKHEILRWGMRFQPTESGTTPFLLPFYEKKEVMINYRFGLEDVDHVPLWQVLKNEVPKNRFHGKTILVGATSRVLHDYYHTPFGFMPGVIVNMNLLVNFLTGDFLKKIPAVVNVLFIFVLTSLASYVGLRANILKGLLLFGLAVLLFVGCFFALFLNNFSGDYFSPVAFAVLTFIVSAFYRYFHTLVENVQLKGKVVTDPLTGLFNRRLLESRVDTELEKLVNVRGDRKTDPPHEFSILMIDIDNFKHINDTYGHQFGDDVLKNIGFTIKDSIRKNDIAARYGGEEFCVLLPHASKEEAQQIGDKIRTAVQARRFSYVNQVTSFTVSVGLASAQEDNLFTSRTLIHAADSALYEAKRQGKNRVCLYTKEKTLR